MPPPSWRDSGWIWNLPLACTDIYKTDWENCDGPGLVMRPPLCAQRWGGEQLEALVQVVLPKSAGVDKGQLSVDTTCVHKNGQDLHKKVHLITIGLSALFVSKCTHPGSPSCHSPIRQPLTCMYPT